MHHARVAAAMPLLWASVVHAAIYMALRQAAELTAGVQ